MTSMTSTSTVNGNGLAKLSRVYDYLDAQRFTLEQVPFDVAEALYAALDVIDDVQQSLGDDVEQAKETAGTKALQSITDIYMVKTGESRSGAQRYYRLFVIDHGMLLDVTKLVAVTVEHVCSGQYVASGPNYNGDLQQLQRRIEAITGTAPDVFRP